MTGYILIRPVTSPLHESRLLWIHDLHPNQPPRVTPRQTVITENRDSVPRNNQQTVSRNYQTVPRNNKIVNHSDARARERPLIIFPVHHGSTLTSRILVFQILVLVSVTQCPGLIYRVIKKQFKCVNKQLALLSPLREKGIINIEGRGVRERERKEVRHLFMMRAGPVSAQETHPVPAFQRK